MRYIKYLYLETAYSFQEAVSMLPGLVFELNFGHFDELIKQYVQLVMLIILFNMLEIKLDVSSHLAECDERWGGRRMEEDVRRKEGGGNMYMLVWRRRKTRQL